jgi:2-keto-4-pentenoate hydratase/2-oxohepta-3-ene-1,7-dioic acid hydratase in catechol pathway
MTETAGAVARARAEEAVPRLVRFRPSRGDDRVVVGLLAGSRVDELAARWEEALEHWALGRRAGAPSGRTFDLEEGSLEVPVGSTSRGLFCVGLNYRSHQAEVDTTLGRYADEKPVIFSKVRESLVAHAEPLSISTEPSAEFDWEVELGVVIGRAGRFVAAEEADAYVGGYTLVNDVTARDVQRAHGQWFLGKNVHRATPVGPSVVHPAALGWPPEGRLRLTVNGEVKQDANTLEMLHGVPALIETISRYVELRAGDIIATGSPSGVGFTREPPEFLAKGDVVRAELVGLLELENEVV